MDNRRKVPLKTKSRATIGPRDPSPGHVPGKDNNSNSKRYMHPMFIAVNVYESQDMEAPKCSLIKE